MALCHSLNPRGIISFAWFRLNENNFRMFLWPNMEKRSKNWCYNVFFSFEKIDFKCPKSTKPWPQVKKRMRFNPCRVRTFQKLNLNFFLKQIDFLSAQIQEKTSQRAVVKFTWHFQMESQGRLSSITHRTNWVETFKVLMYTTV